MTKAIELVGVQKRYGRTVALADLNLSIDAGVIYGLLGPNGAGKTTSVRICSTLLGPDAGTVFLDGEDIARAGRSLRRQIALMPQGRALDPMLNVADNLRYYCKLHRIPSSLAVQSIERVTEEFGLRSFMDKNVFALSGGQFRRAQLARTFLGDARFVFLDEPTLGVDIQGKLSIWSAIRNYVTGSDCTVLITSNDLMEIERTCDRIGFINNGRLLYSGLPPDSVPEVITTFRCILKKPYTEQRTPPPEGVKVHVVTNQSVSLTMTRLDPEEWMFISTLSKECGMESIEQQRVDLVDLFAQYGGVQQ